MTVSKPSMDGLKAGGLSDADIRRISERERKMKLIKSNILKVNGRFIT